MVDEKSERGWEGRPLSLQDQVTKIGPRPPTPGSGPDPTSRHRMALEPLCVNAFPPNPAWSRIIPPHSRIKWWSTTQPSSGDPAYQPES